MLEREGYRVSVKQAGKLGEDIFEQLGFVLSQQAVINKSMQEINKANTVVTLKNIGLTGTWDGSTFIISGDMIGDFIPALEAMGGKKKVAPRK
ncbi:MAG: hypothetical protein WC799_19735 [Desulfobacteraceae bacterium]|jgi:hypothetical protein